MTEQPFWEQAYADPDAAETFGPPAEELQNLAPLLPSDAAVLDLGCGEGRNALYLAEQGCRVTAVDLSRAGIRKLRRRARKRGLAVDARVQDLCRFTFAARYDLIVAHGVLHLLEPTCRDRLLEDMRAYTKPEGYNVVVAFTDTLPPPGDLAPFTVGLFREGELFERYADWHSLEQRSYVLEDEHPGGIRHRHPINKLVAQHPSV